MTDKKYLEKEFAIELEKRMQEITEKCLYTKTI